MYFYQLYKGYISFKHIYSSFTFKPLSGILLNNHVRTTGWNEIWHRKGLVVEIACHFISGKQLIKFPNSDEINKCNAFLARKVYHVSI